MSSRESEVIEVPHPQTGEPLGWLVVDTVRNGLSFGGCRMKPDVTREEVMELARAMSWKLFCHGEPTGGAKAGIRLNPAQEDADELLRHFGSCLSDHLASGVVLGKDMGATNVLMATLYEGAGVSQLAPLGDVPFQWLRDFRGYRKHMTGLGVAMATCGALGTSDLTGLKVAIQGAGVVGLGTAVRLHALGADIVAMSDVERCVTWDHGVSIPDLLETAEVCRNLSAVKTTAEHPREDLFSQDADLLVLAASSYSVSEASVRTMRAPLIVEGANMAFGNGARELAFLRGHEVIPDVIASSSSAGMVCSQLERRGAWEEQELWDQLESGISDAIRLGRERAATWKISLREGHIRRFLADDAEGN